MSCRAYVGAAALTLSRADEEKEVQRVRRGDDQHDDDAGSHAVSRIEGPSVPEQAGANHLATFRRKNQRTGALV